MRRYDRSNKGMIVIGGNGKEEETNQFNGLGDLSFDF
jgi:hypothetical protein